MGNVLLDQLVVHNGVQSVLPDQLTVHNGGHDSAVGSYVHHCVVHEAGGFSKTIFITDKYDGIKCILMYRSNLATLDFNNSICI